MSSFALTRIPSTKDSGRLGAWGTWHRCSALENHVILPTHSFLQSILQQPLPQPPASPESLGKVSLSHCHPTTSLRVTCDMTTFLLCSSHLFSRSVSGHSSFLPICLTLLARCGGTGGSPQLWRGDDRRKTSLLTLLTQLDLAYCTPTTGPLHVHLRGSHPVVEHFPSTHKVRTWQNKRAAATRKSKIFDFKMKMPVNLFQSVMRWGVLSAGSPLQGGGRLGLLQLWGVCSCQITTEPVLGLLLGLEQLFLLL